MFLRLRQLCLVAEQLDPVTADLSAVFGTTICHRDPEVGRFGLHNALLPFGTSFVEVVAPVKAGTTAGRYLERRAGDGGYMVILDTDDLPQWRRHLAALGVRMAASLAIGDYEGEQLHPRDTGGALLEINTTRGGTALNGPYGPAGPEWQHHVRTERVAGIAGAVLQSDDPGRLARRWGEILRREPIRNGDQWQIEVDNARLRFVRAIDGRGEGLSGIDVRIVDPQAAIAIASARGCRTDATGVHVGGVRFQLETETAARG